MKKIFTFLFVLLVCVSISNAQYYYLPFANAGQNPGGLNNDVEAPVGGGLPGGWTSITAATNPTPTWSTTQTIPFGFSFNGAAVTQFKVSTSGIVTFDVATALAAPSYTKAALPNAAIPDNSICIWGLSSLGTNDYVVTKTFGTAPNRQLWIQFNSFGYGAVASTGSLYTYWSIVLAETSNTIYIVDQRTGGYTAAQKVVSAGIQINSSTAVSIAGSPNLAALAGTNNAPADNSYYAFFNGTQPAAEVELKSLTSIKFIVAPGAVSIKGSLKNNGTSAINSIDIKYLVGGNTYTDTKTGLNIPSAGIYNFTHVTPLNVVAPGLNNMKVWVELAGDANHSNDTLGSYVSALNFLPNKRIVFEEGTGTWCGWCPRGAVFMDSLANLFPNNVLLLAEHNSDQMSVAAIDGPSPISSFPGGIVDRIDVGVDPSTFITLYNQHINDVVPCNVDVISTYNPSTSVAYITVSANFAGDAIEDYRFNIAITEDNVTGTGDGTNQNNLDYDQENYYSFQSQNQPLQGAGHNWQTETNPVLATNMVYDHVARAMLGGWNGYVGSLPATMTSNSTYTYSTGYQIPATSDISKLHVIGWVSDGATGHIINANSNTFVTAIHENDNSIGSLLVYPNPTNDLCNLNLNLKNSGNIEVIVTDVFGKIVLSQDFGKQNSGFVKKEINVKNLASGIYNLSIQTTAGFISQKFVKQ